MIHLPAVLSGEFGIARSDARRRIALGRVKVNGVVVTDMDIPMPEGDGAVAIELESRPTEDAITNLLAAQADALAMEVEDA